MDSSRESGEGLRRNWRGLRIPKISQLADELFTYETPSQRAGLAWRCVLPRCPLLPSRAPRLPPVFFNTSTEIGHACCAASHCGDLGAWPRTKGACRVCASASQQRPEVHRRAHLVGHGARWTGDLPMRTAYRMDCAARETCTQPPYRCSPGMSLTCEQTGHTGALCVC